MIKRILVPVDGSALAEAAFPLALAVAKRSGADIHLVLVHADGDREADFARHALYLERTSESLRALVGPETSVSSELLDGDVAQALCTAAGATPGLVVMGSHGHGGLTRVWLGSVTEAVLRGCPSPVVVVKSDPDAADGPLAACTVRHVMVPLDGTGFAETAIEPARELARLLGASLTLFRAVSPSPAAFEHLIDTPERTAEVLQQRQVEAREYLESTRSKLEDGQPEIAVAVGVHRSAAESVLDFAGQNDVDLIVLATHARRGMERTLLGSVADKVLRASTAPLVVVHPTDEQAPQSREAPQVEVAATTTAPPRPYAEPTRYQHIMLPLDGSPTGECAIPLAATIARRADATLHVVTVAELSGRTHGGEEYLAGIVGKIADDHGCRVTATVRSGVTLDNLHEHLRSSESDVTVMATHGRGGLSRAWLGSVATDFLSETDRPVILVRPDEDGDAASDSVSGFSRILVPLDGSPFSERCLDHAVMLGGLFDATYHLTRVVLLPAEVPVTYFQTEQAAAKAYLEEHAERMRSNDGVVVSTSATLDRQAGPAILKVGVAEECDSIAMTTSARSGIRRALFGSTADKVLRGGRVPMLLYGPKLGGT